MHTAVEQSAAVLLLCATIRRRRRTAAPRAGRRAVTRCPSTRKRRRAANHQPARPRGRCGALRTSRDRSPRVSPNNPLVCSARSPAPPRRLSAETRRAEEMRAANLWSQETWAQRQPNRGPRSLLEQLVAELRGKRRVGQHCLDDSTLLPGNAHRITRSRTRIWRASSCPSCPCLGGQRPAHRSWRRCSCR